MDGRLRLSRHRGRPGVEGPASGERPGQLHGPFLGDGDAGVRDVAALHGLQRLVADDPCGNVGAAQGLYEGPAFQGDGGTGRAGRRRGALVPSGQFGEEPFAGAGGEDMGQHVGLGGDRRGNGDAVRLGMVTQLRQRHQVKRLVCVRLGGGGLRRGGRDFRVPELVLRRIEIGLVDDDEPARRFHAPDPHCADVHGASYPAMRQPSSRRTTSAPYRMS